MGHSRQAHALIIPARAFVVSVEFFSAGRVIPLPDSTERDSFTMCFLLCFLLFSFLFDTPTPFYFLYF